MKITKTFITKAEPDADTRTVTARISTQAVDRDGDVLVADGMDASDFLKNPVVFFNHNYDVPIGKATSVKKGDGQVVATTKFPERPETHSGEWLPDTILSMFVAGVLRGFSVGFNPLPGSPRKATKADTEKYGEGVNQVFSKWQLFEYSVAPLPCNQDALSLAVNKSIITKGRAAELFPGVELVAPRRKTVVFIDGGRKPRPNPTPRKSVADHAVLSVRKLKGEMYE